MVPSKSAARVVSCASRNRHARTVSTSVPYWCAFCSKCTSWRADDEAPTGDNWAVLGELDAEAFSWRAVHTRREAVDDPAGDELEVAEGRQHGGVKLIGARLGHVPES